MGCSDSSLKTNQKKFKKNKVNIDNIENKEIYIEWLYQSYNKVKEYFSKNNLKEQEEDSNKKLEKIKEIKENYNKGNSNNLKELPDEVDPEYIYGTSSEERDDTFINIINSLLELKSLLKENEAENINKEILKLREYQSKIWCRPPEINKEKKEFDIKKVNKEIPENTMKINIFKITYTKSNSIVKFLIDLDGKQETKEVKIKNYKDVNETFEWKFDEKDWKSLNNKKLNIILERSYSSKDNKVKGKGIIYLNAFNDMASDEQTVILKMENKKKKKTFIGLKIYIRCPFENIEYEKEIKEKVEIKKMYEEYIPVAKDFDDFYHNIYKKN